MNITLRQIQALLAVADSGSFTRAAERLHVAQPALSQHVRDLDDVQLSGDRLQRHGYLYLANSQDYAQRAADLFGSELLPIGSALAMIGAGSKGVTRA